MCQVYCKPGYLPADGIDGSGCMTCTLGQLSNQVCEAKACGSGQEPTADGLSCAPCLPNDYNPAGDKCEHCLDNFKPSADNTCYGGRGPAGVAKVSWKE